MRTSFVTAFLASACLVAAAPAVEPAKREMNFGSLFGPLAGLIGANGGGVGNGVANAGQSVTAELFKAGDAILNLPGDAIGKVLSGDPIGAVTSTLGNVVKLATQLPGDAVKIVTGA
jgi:hypothetical protein